MAGMRRKVRQVTQATLGIFLLLALRTWQLSVVEKDLYQKKADRPKRRTQIEKPERGEIHDRNGAPLAINRIVYHAAIYYGDILGLPRVRYKKNADGTKTKEFFRKNYIQTLANVLGKELAMDPLEIEDTIHAKAAACPNAPHLIKKNLTEKEYYRLKILERDFPGLVTEIGSERFYPHGKVACDILGHMGAIQRKEYLQFRQKQEELRCTIRDYEEGALVYFPPYAPTIEKVYAQKTLLDKRRYSIHDSVGKMGLEQRFEPQLRGLTGKKQFEVGVKGNFLQEMDFEPAQPGKKIQLHLSLPLQKYAEELLAEDEATRDGRSYVITDKKRIQKEPWIKGGAIVVLDPTSGAVLALASHPRFDPNDYIKSGDIKVQSTKKDNLDTWLETTRHIAHIWEGKKPLSRERFDQKRGFYEEHMTFSWDAFLSLTLDTCMLEKARSIRTVLDAVSLQEEVEKLLYHASIDTVEELFNAIFCKKKSLPFPLFSHLPEEKARSMRQKAESFRKKWTFFHGINDVQDQVFLVDIARLAVCSSLFSTELLSYVKDMELSTYFSCMQELSSLQPLIKKEMKKTFHQTSFVPWRKREEKAFLRKKRLEEKAKKKAAKPYTSLLKQEESRQFALFWKENRWRVLQQFLEKNDQDKTETSPPCLFSIQAHKKEHSFLTKALFSIREDLKIPFLKTFRLFHQLKRPLYHSNKRRKKPRLEQDLAASFYPFTGFGFGKSYAYKENTTLGSIFKTIVSYSALCKKIQENPEGSLDLFTMIDKITFDQKGSMIVGYDLKGKPYPRYYQGGRLPKSYSRYLGKVDLIAALERSSNPYFSLLSKNYLDHPRDLLYAMKTFGLGEKTGLDVPGEIAGSLPTDLDRNVTGLYSCSIGQHTLAVTPIQIACMMGAFATKELLEPHIVQQVGSQKIKKRLRHELYLPDRLQKRLFTGLEKVLTGEKGTARLSAVKACRRDKTLRNTYKKLSSHIVGKTSTAQITRKLYANPSAKAEIYRDIWFGCISFEETEKKWEKPELVVIVYLRFGDAGKEAAPLAIKMIDRYRQLQQEKKM